MTEPGNECPECGTRLFGHRCPSCGWNFNPGPLSSPAAKSLRANREFPERVDHEPTEAEREAVRTLIAETKARLWGAKRASTKLPLPQLFHAAEVTTTSPFVSRFDSQAARDQEILRQLEALRGSLTDDGNNILDS